MYSIHNEGKSVVAGRFIRTLKTKIYKYTILVSKNVYISNLDDIVGEYDNIYHRSIKMKPVDVNDKDPKFKVEDLVRISKYKIIFAKEYTPNWSDEVFVVSKIKNAVPWAYFINDLNGE